MNPVAEALWNPIVAKEYRSRMRTWRSPVAMTVYILLLGGLGWAIFSSMTFAARNSFNGGQAANYGQGLFLYLVLFQMVLLAFIGAVRRSHRNTPCRRAPREVSRRPPARRGLPFPSCRPAEPHD